MRDTRMERMVEKLYPFENWLERQLNNKGIDACDLTEEEYDWWYEMWCVETNMFENAI